MVGTISLALTQQLDEYGEPLAGGQLYFIQAGTVSTPQNAFQDSGLTVPLPNPVTLDSAGRIPMFYLADGQIKVRLQDVNGVVKFTQDNLLVVGPSSGGGGGTVDPTTILATGDIKFRYDTAIISGFVRLNGRTIGSASSGASELADPSAQALFQFLWNTDNTLTVAPGGRGASASADWTANKTITLPDGRNRLLAALDGMGNSNVGYLNGATYSKGNATTLGSMAGNAATPGVTMTLATANLPPYTPAGTVSTSTTLNMGGSLTISPGGTPVAYGGTSSGGNTSVTPTVSSSSSFSGSAQGGTSTPFGIAPPILLITVYCKL